MTFLIIYMLVSTIVLAILSATGLCKFEWASGEETLKTGLWNILYLLTIILVWPIITLILIINGRKSGRK